jgi:pimeloyl-ACP methyl ester carboxylesterase
MSVGGPHRIAFTDWGPIGSSVPVICVPGLTRQGRDFDFLAAELARCGRRVLLISLVADGAADS